MNALQANILKIVAGIAAAVVLCFLDYFKIDDPTLKAYIYGVFGLLLGHQLGAAPFRPAPVQPEKTE